MVANDDPVAGKRQTQADGPADPARPPATTATFNRSTGPAGAGWRRGSTLTTPLPLSTSRFACVLDPGLQIKRRSRSCFFSTVQETVSISPTRTGSRKSSVCETQRAPAPGSCVPINVESKEAPSMPCTTMSFEWRGLGVRTVHMEGIVVAGELDEASNILLTDPARQHGGVANLNLLELFEVVHGTLPPRARPFTITVTYPLA